MDNKEFIKALDNIAKEKNISKDVIFDAMELAMQTAYKKNFDSKTNVKVTIDRETGEVKVYSYLIVVKKLDTEIEKDEEGNIIREPEINPDAQILLSDAKKIKKDAKIGDEIETEVTPADFGRVAAGTAKQVLMQKVREAEKASIISEFEGKEGEMMVGFLAMEDAKNYYVDLGRTRGILPKGEMIPDEVVKMGSSIKVYITKVESTVKGPLILCSRKHYGFVKRLFEAEIPELADGTIILHSVAREPGIRSKVALYSTNSKVDPIGACIGERGSRIGNILKELNGEKVDLILYSEDDAEFIKNSLSPAKNVIVNITDPEERTALAIVDQDNLSLAIGKKGSNIKLASRLTKYRIELKTLEQINEEGNKN
ncbi:MAG TPA: transcription termination factor NusA [Bacilli bacterium]|mgnify:CR=1 FL=1|nr:transcription termination factor NusA [Bacilli bacterium]